MIPIGTKIKFPILGQPRESLVIHCCEYGAFLEYVLVFSNHQSKVMREFFNWEELSDCEIVAWGGVCE